MSEQIVSISANGTVSPPDIRVRPGDTVSFRTEADTVLCVDPASFFGGERYEIPSRQSADLVVQPEATGTFEYIAIVGDLDEPCRGGRDRRGGGGGGGVD